MKDPDISSLDVSSLKQMVRDIKKKYQENEMLATLSRTPTSWKWMCKQDNIAVHTNKAKLVEAIQNHRRRMRSLVKIQSRIRGFLVRLFWKGYRRTAKRSCVNETDFYTLEPIEEIPVELYYVYKSGHVQYGFNVCSLMIYYHKNRFNSKSLLNPYNREEIQIKPIQQMIRFMHLYFPKTYSELENQEFFKTFMKVTFSPLRLAVSSLFNASRQADNLAIPVGAGRDYQGAHAIAIGSGAGTNQQANHAIAVGGRAGSNQQDSHPIAVGGRAGPNQPSNDAIAVGGRAGPNQPSNHAIAVGGRAGPNQRSSHQGVHAIAVGAHAGSGQQGVHAIAVGAHAGSGQQGVHALPIETGTETETRMFEITDRPFGTFRIEPTTPFRLAVDNAGGSFAAGGSAEAGGYVGGSAGIVYNAPILTEPLHMELLQNLTELSSLPVHRRIHELFIDFDLFGNYTNSLWFSTLSIRGYKIFFMKVRELWNHLPGVVQQSICCIGDPFYLVNIGDINRIRSVLDMKMACIRLMEYMTHGGVSREDQKIGVYQLLIALTHVSREARQALHHLL